MEEIKNTEAIEEVTEETLAELSDGKGDDDNE